MTEQDKQKLNEKLAKWAGLHRNEPHGGRWWDEEDNEIFDFHHPETKGFTDSLDACFHWLVPKLGFIKIEMDVIASKRAVLIPSGLWLVIIEDAPKEKITCVRWIQRAETPALALCLAIEKLIEEK